MGSEDGEIGLVDGIFDDKLSTFLNGGKTDRPNLYVQAPKCAAASVSAAVMTEMLKLTSKQF